MDLRGQEEKVSKELLDAPWQGLRFLPTEQEWRFYGWTGETRQIKFMTTFDLIKVYYLQADGDLTFTWVTTGVEISGRRLPVCRTLNGSTRTDRSCAVIRQTRWPVGRRLV